MILLTVSPKEAVALLNGNAASLVRSWKVPLGTAYIAVKKEKPELHRYDSWNGEEWERHYLLRKSPIGEWLQNGLVVAKCVVEKAEQFNLEQLDGHPSKFERINKPACLTDDELFTYLYNKKNRSKNGIGYALHLTALSVLDKPMEVGQFKPIKKAKYDGFAWEITNAKNGMIAMDDGMYNIGDPITRFPSRWQEVEVGE